MVNNDQKVYELEGPLLLLAGPGTGKTWSIIKRIKFLVEELNYNPDNISVITFTAAAAANMRSRLSDSQKAELFVPPEYQPSTICTMHSLGHRIITDKASDLGLSSPIGVVRLDSTRNILLGDAAQLSGYKRVKAKEVWECRQYGDCRAKDEPKCKICECYKKILKACNSVDHDEQIILACEILESDKTIREKYQAKARDLLIDEYQDINAGQFRLIKLLTKGQLDGLFAVGDDDQSIYSWRGGSPDFIRNFEDHFGPKSDVLPLKHSYRCNPNILEGALSIVKKYDEVRKDKGTITYERTEGPKIVIHNVPSDKREAIIVKSIIEEALPSKQVLVLVPRRAYASLIVEKLRKAKIEFVAPQDPPGSGLPTMERLVSWLIEGDDSIALRESVEFMLNSKFLKIPSSLVRKPEKKKEREDAFATVGYLWNSVLNDGCSLWESLNKNHKQSELLTSIYEICYELQSIDNKKVPDFLHLSAKHLEPWITTNSLFDEIATWVNRYNVSPGVGFVPAVKIMTLEGAKGLEADVVCVVGMEDGTMPNESGDRGLDEYSRLMYVSMTRAVDELHLFHTRKRSGAVSYQQVDYKKGFTTLSPSRFLEEIPKEFAERTYHPAKK